MCIASETAGARACAWSVPSFDRACEVLQWYLKRGDYDCCTGLCGLTDTYLGFPRSVMLDRRSAASMVAECASSRGAAGVSSATLALFVGAAPERDPSGARDEQHAGDR